MSDINTPTGGNDKYKSILEHWNELSLKEQNELLTILQQDRKKIKIEKKNLIGNTDAILNDLKENHVKIEENAEMMGYKGKKVHIDLPGAGNFEGYKFDYFVSDEAISKNAFERSPELEKKSYSMSDVSKLLQAMNKYMIELNGKNDGDTDYETKLKAWEASGTEDIYTSIAGYCLSVIARLLITNSYWLSDKDMETKNSRAIWSNVGYGYFDDRIYGNYDANLFLRLSD